MLPSHVVQDLPYDACLAIECGLQQRPDAYDILDHLHGQGVCMSLQQPAHNLKAMLTQYHKQHRKIARYIDPLSQRIGSSMALPEAILVPTHDLHHLTEAIHTAFQGLPLGERFIVIDALHVLKNFYPEHTLARFVETVQQVARKHRAKTVLMYDPTLLSRTFRSFVRQQALHVVALH